MGKRSSGATGSRGKGNPRSSGKARAGNAGGVGLGGAARAVAGVGGRIGAGLFGDRARTVRSLSNATTAVLVLGVVAGVVFGREPLRQAAARAVGQAPSVRFEWPRGVDGAVWIDTSEQARLEDGVLAQLGDPSRDEQASLEAAHRWLTSTGWLRDLTMRRNSGGVVIVQGRWRVPTAEVRQDRSADAWVVGEDAAPIDTASVWALPKIVGVRFDPLGRAGGAEAEGAPGVYGAPWGTGEVEAGLALLARVRTLHKGEQFAGVDVSGFTREPPELVLLSDRAFRIRWGGPLGAPNPGEPDDARKLAMLARLVELTGRVDGDKPLLDLRTGRIEIDRTSGVTPADVPAARARRDG